MTKKIAGIGIAVAVVVVIFVSSVVSSIANRDQAIEAFSEARIGYVEATKTDEKVTERDKVIDALKNELSRRDLDDAKRETKAIATDNDVLRKMLTDTRKRLTDLQLAAHKSEVDQAGLISHKPSELIERLEAKLLKEELARVETDRRNTQLERAALVMGVSMASNGHINLPRSKDRIAEGEVFVESLTQPVQERTLATLDYEDAEPSVMLVSTNYKIDSESISPSDHELEETVRTAETPSVKPKAKLCILRKFVGIFRKK